MDMNPGTDDGETNAHHYDISWNIDDDIKYDYVALVGKINGMSGSDEIGIKSGDCSAGACQWSDSKDEDSDWDAHVSYNGVALTEMQVPRDWDGSGTVDSDEFPTDQNDGACFTFALVNTNNDWVYGSYPDQEQDSDVTFTQCLFWNELNSDIDNVWSEMYIASSEGIPEFSTLVMPIASVLAIVGLNNRRKKL